jgi:hypothetical protein
VAEAKIDIGVTEEAKETLAELKETADALNGTKGAKGWKSDKFKVTVITAAGIGGVASLALGASLVFPSVNAHAVELHVDGSWWLYAVALAASVATGFNIINVAQDGVFKGFDALKAKFLGAAKKPPAQP